MPHDVIMPALGMAQDTGKIVRWLKTSGEPVSSGEAIMEVETDKAVMEVEAAADGFLSAVSAGDGDDVPVGSVVAVIVDSENDVESAKPDEDAGGERVPSASEADEESLPDGAEIIMPALGMAQDTGLIVNWCKEPGDKVSASDILLEVETDKSVMEVEAGHDGYIAAILADADEAVPVGSVIAVISAEKPENPCGAAPKRPKRRPNCSLPLMTRSKSGFGTGQRSVETQNPGTARRAGRRSHPCLAKGATACP
nr:biotin/lipoyl-containing protein [Marinicella sp. W31]MDC2878656.1 hypothetical protein [Marinicella sp. W31]